MASSVTKPDPSSPADVSTATFSAARRGYDPDEVREFLRLVAAELARLKDRESKLEDELLALQQAPPVSLAELDDAAVKQLASDEAARLLATARETAAQMKTRAEEASSRLLIEANEEAQRVRAEAEVDAGRRRQDASAAAEDELQMAKQQGRDMVNEARAYRERVLTELSRRRDLARQQIEQLIQSRERLMQSFEKSRLIAVDVMAELAPRVSGELVDLTSITGPVPVVKSAAKSVPKPQPIAQPEPVVAIVAEPVAAPLIEPVVVVPVAHVVAAKPNEPSVDDLFARLRAESKPAAPKPKPKPKATATTKTSTKTRAKPREKKVSVEPDQLSVFQATPPEPQDVVAPTGDSPFARRDAELAPLVAAGARNLKRVLADEQNDVMQRLRARQPVRETAAVLPAAEVHNKRYVDALADELMSAAAAGAASVDTASRDAQRAAIIREAALLPAFEALTATIVSPLRDRIERAVNAADGDNGELVNLTRTIYREWKTQRIDEHLEHVVHLAFGRGALAVLKPGTPVCWALDPSRPACPDAEDNALAGAVGAGEKFPTEHTSAPAHEGCRCMLLLAAR